LLLLWWIACVMETARPLATTNAVDHPPAPNELNAAVRERVAQLIADRLAPNTRRSFAAAIAYVVAWWHCRYRVPFPLPAHALPIESIATWLTDHSVVLIDGVPTLHMSTIASSSWIDAALVAAGVKAHPGPLRWSTLRHRLDVLSAAHARHGFPSLLQDPAIQDLIRGCRKNLDAAGLVRQHRAPPLMRDAISAILATCDDSMEGIRDRAMLLFGWPRRRSEIAAARLDRLRRNAASGESGSVTYLYELTGGKTQDAGDVVLIPIMGTAAENMERWLNLLAIHGHDVTSGPLFRRITRATKHAGIAISATGISESTVVRMLVRRCALAGIDAGPGRAFSGHSLRRGFVSEALGKLPVSDVMAITGHRTSRMVLETYAEVAAGTNRGGRLFDL